MSYTSLCGINAVNANFTKPKLQSTLHIRIKAEILSFQLTELKIWAKTPETDVKVFTVGHYMEENYVQIHNFSFYQETRWNRLLHAEFEPVELRSLLSNGLCPDPDSGYGIIC